MIATPKPNRHLYITVSNQDAGIVARLLFGSEAMLYDFGPGTEPFHAYPIHFDLPTGEQCRMILRDNRFSGGEIGDEISSIGSLPVTLLSSDRSEEIRIDCTISQTSAAMKLQISNFDVNIKEVNKLHYEELRVSGAIETTKIDKNKNKTRRKKHKHPADRFAEANRPNKQFKVRLPEDLIQDIDACVALSDVTKQEWVALQLDRAVKKQLTEVEEKINSSPDGVSLI